MRGQLNHFSQIGYDVITVSSPGPQVKAIIEREHCRHFNVSFTRKITPLRDLIALIRLISLLRTINPQIVHTHTPKAGLIGMLASWICRIPVRLHTVAGLPLIEKRGLIRSLLLITEYITYRCAHKVYPNSSGLLDFLNRQFPSLASKFALIGKGSTNGIDTEVFSSGAVNENVVNSLRAGLNLSSVNFVFLFVGRIVKAKGIHELVQAFEKIRKDSPSIRLILIGDFEADLDPLDDEILSIINDREEIIMPGFQTDVRPWFQLADAFVFPSYREGLPNVVMQAASMEVPCIVSDINGCNELIERDKSGWLVPSKDYNALELAMRDCYMNPEKRKVFALSALTFIKENYQQKVLWRLIEREYILHLNKADLV